MIHFWKSQPFFCYVQVMTWFSCRWPCVFVHSCCYKVRNHDMKKNAGNHHMIYMKKIWIMWITYDSYANQPLFRTPQKLNHVVLALQTIAGLHGQSVALSICDVILHLFKQSMKITPPLSSSTGCHCRVVEVHGWVETTQSDLLENLDLKYDKWISENMTERSVFSWQMNF